VSKTPGVSGKQLVKILERQGRYVKRVRGSHHIMRHPTVPDAIPVPVHGNQPIKKARSATSCAPRESPASSSIGCFDDPGGLRSGRPAGEHRHSGSGACLAVREASRIYD
jgi:predicted RNA binding protein YcfA (HicA-like mRNA interferase family)